METFLSKVSISDSGKQICRDVLYEQILSYPKTQWNSMNDGETLLVNGQSQQRTGQLMGSILSFPHLCAVNLVGYWITLEKYLGRRIPLRSLPVLINGDDILFKSNSIFYSMWCDTIKELGFELSLGKNYLHPNLLMVNSLPFWRNSSGLHPVPFLNTGLLTGQSKLSGRSTERLLPIWDIYNYVIKGCVNPLWSHFRYLHLNKKWIEECSQNGNYNLFIDHMYGGLGFELHPTVKPYVKFTPFQRKFGNFLWEKTREFHGDLSRFKSMMGVVQESEDSKVSSFHRYHYGNYIYRNYHNQGTFSNPIHTLVISDEERLPLDYTLNNPPFVGEPVSKSVLKVVHPKTSVLREFRESLSVSGRMTSIGRLLTKPGVYVEQVTVN
jgi:hypothetical protein